MGFLRYSRLFFSYCVGIVHYHAITKKSDENLMGGTATNSTSSKKYLSFGSANACQLLLQSDSTRVGSK
jgi:hypothetical protein